ncbi:unnamed protein product [Gemmata massiliana]|uniref:Uncharacterized protein n=1 Tax=Gemmata massiliana TaxID=1210884 RepID=A0A6P2DGY4_9BACT|nr:hypothetical protein [Gemmata massiliana]VTS00898.1 unnamed protein product [Gemmata massiliana]
MAISERVALRRRIGLAVAVWGLRLAALSVLVLWFIPTRQYESTENAERTYFGLGWPDHWLASEVTLTFRPTVRRDGTWSYEFHRRGPLTAWDRVPDSMGLEDAFTYHRWKRENPLYGPLWQTAVGGVFLLVAVYLNQFRRDRPVKAATTVSSATPAPE